MNTVANSLQLVFNPLRAWQNIAAEHPSVWRTALTHTLPLAALPAVFWYVGVTQRGWRIGSGDPVRLTAESALPMCALFFLAMVAGVLFLGFLVHWMAATYNAENPEDSTLARGVTLVSYTATPFFLAGVLGLVPVLWFDILAGTLVGCYCIYLLYLGTPIVMRVKPELGFLYASAVFAAALVGLVSLMGATVVLWDLGAAPVYAY